MNKNKLAALLMSGLVLTGASALPASAAYISVNTSFTEESITASNTEEFVTRLYRYCLGREPDKAGLDNWAGQLGRGETAAKVSLGFLNSSELKNKKLSNSEYIGILYNVFLDRNGSASEIAHWTEIADKGVSKNYLIRGFLHSSEFTNICNSYGVTRGSITLTESRDVNPEVTAFVTRLYRYCLNREPDTAGLNNWARQLNSGATAANVSMGFLKSDELKNKNLSSREFVEILYKVYLDRNGSDSEVTKWAETYDGGVSQNYMIHGFLHSSEFTNLCARYGISRGSLQLTFKDKHPQLAANYSSDTLARYAYQVAAIVNRERAANGVAPLKFSLDLSNAAIVRSNELQISFSHTRPDGSLCYTAVEDLGVYWYAIGENCAYGNNLGPQAAMTRWMNSEGHRANILDTDYDYIGVGVTVKNGIYYYVQIFASSDNISGEVITEADLAGLK